MSVLSMMRGAGALQESAKLLAIAAGPEARAALGMRTLLLEGAAGKLLAGSSEVRLLGGPFFGRMADDLASHAAGVTSGASLTPAITSAMDGASWLLKRVAHSAS